MIAPPPLRLDQVTLQHGRSVAVRGLTGVFAPGSLTAVVGPNGAGKTTLLRAIAGVHPVASGRIDRGGLRPEQIALLPQGSGLDRAFPLSCLDVVALGLTGQIGAFRGLTRAQRTAAADALAAVGLPDHAERSIGALSTGQFQRVLFARMMLQDAPVLLMDEPFAGVDAATEDDLLALIAGWSRQGRTMVVVLHDLAPVRAMFPQTLHLSTALVAWAATDTVLAAMTQQHERLQAA